LVLLRTYITGDLGHKELIVVPQRQILNFIAVAGNKQEKFIYLSNEEATIKQGSKIRITGGVFEGVEGLFLMRMKGDKRVVVRILNLLYAATAFVPTCFIQPLEMTE